MDADFRSDDAREARFRKLIELGILLSAERSHDKLLEMLLLAAKEMSGADAATLYVVDRDKQVLTFAILRNDTLGIAEGGTTGRQVQLPPVPLVGADGTANLKNVAAYAANTGETVTVADAYSESDAFDFSGVRTFDALTGYHSRAFLTVPMKDNAGIVAGVLQLINPPGEFPADIVPLIQALSSQAAVALDNANLLQAQKNLLLSFVQVIAEAIDSKSPYTAGHCQRVPVLTEMLTKAAVAAQDGPFAAFAFTDDDWFELHVASWMHDCGKVVTPEHVVDKSTKLQTIADRIETVKVRFAALRQQAEAEHWRAVAAGGDPAALGPALEARLAQLESDRKFLEEINLGGEFMAAPKLERLKALAGLRWVDADGHPQPLLSENEVENLSVARGTLTDAERKVINDHIVVTMKMLNKLPWPSNMRNVVDYAGSHHEKMDGTGYPRGLTREQLSIPARAMAIADIFEALTAADRPYKKAKTLSETIKIMSFMKKDNHIDPDLFDLFLTSGVYRRYAEKHLHPEQIDEVDIRAYVSAPAAAAPV